MYRLCVNASKFSVCIQIYFFTAIFTLICDGNSSEVKSYAYCNLRESCTSTNFFVQNFKLFYLLNCLGNIFSLKLRSGKLMHYKFKKIFYKNTNATFPGSECLFLGYSNFDPFVRKFPCGCIIQGNEEPSDPSRIKCKISFRLRILSVNPFRFEIPSELSLQYPHCHSLGRSPQPLIEVIISQKLTRLLFRHSSE